jgi:hypothetical protein
MSNTKLSHLLEDLEDELTNTDGEVVTFENLSESDIDGILELISSTQIQNIVHQLLRPKESHRRDEEFDVEELAKGIEVEKEHYDSPYMQKAIAKAHLNENPLYYKKLKTLNL